MPPRIPNTYLESAVYLYPDESSARKGEAIGGSGFVVRVPFENSDEDIALAWVVSNRHVVEKGAWTIRVNAINGFDIIDTNEKQWFYHPDGDDLAICPFYHKEHHKFGLVPIGAFLSEEQVCDYAIGPGDPAFVVGRFVNHEGRQRNTPTIRFGQIAQMPIEKLVCEGQKQESFLVEIRSIGGYSGSPVYIHLDSQYGRPIETGMTHDGKAKAMGVFETGPWLLGVDWCMVPTWEPVCDSSGNELSNGWIVPNNSGMMGVIPAWRLTKLFLEHEPVVRFRERTEAEILTQRKTTLPSVIPTSGGSEPPTTAENPRHKEDFNRLLDAAVKGPKSDD